MLALSAPAKAHHQTCDTSFWQGHGGCAALLGEREQTAREGEHTDGEAQSAIPPQWLCDALGAGGGCRGHLFFYPSVGM